MTEKNVQNHFLTEEQLDALANGNADKHTMREAARALGAITGTRHGGGAATSRGDLHWRGQRATAFRERLMNEPAYDELRERVDRLLVWLDTMDDSAGIAECARRFLRGETIRGYNTERLEHEVGPYFSMRIAEKAEDGVLRNLNHEKFYTDIVEREDTNV